MEGLISGQLVDAVTGSIPLSSTVSLTQSGVFGETLIKVDEHGHFAFHALTAGEYCLGVHDDRYAPLYRRFALEEGEAVENLKIPLTPGAFITGRILDEEGYPAHRCHFTLIRAGQRRERSGYISDSGDHHVARDGIFSSPALYPGQYFLRFAGILRKPTEIDPLQTVHAVMRQRVFDFLYPNAVEIEQASPFEIKTGQILSGLEVRIPRPIWRSVQGRIIGSLPKDLTNISVNFMRDVGMLDDFGSAGFKVNPDGTFEGDAQPGRYRLTVWEMAPPKTNGYTQVIRRFASVLITVANRDVEGIEIHMDPSVSTSIQTTVVD